MADATEFQLVMNDWADIVDAGFATGALIAAANWPVTLIQAVADSLFKLLIAAPLVGGIFLVAVVVGADPRVLLSLVRG